MGGRNKQNETHSSSCSILANQMWFIGVKSSEGQNSPEMGHQGSKNLGLSKWHVKVF